MIRAIGGIGFGSRDKEDFMGDLMGPGDLAADIVDGVEMDSDRRPIKILYVYIYIYIYIYTCGVGRTAWLPLMGRLGE
jgi:hypothetical protein